MRKKRPFGITLLCVFLVSFFYLELVHLSLLVKTLNLAVEILSIERHSKPFSPSFPNKESEELIGVSENEIIPVKNFACEARKMAQLSQREAMKVLFCLASLPLLFYLILFPSPRKYFVILIFFLFIAGMGIIGAIFLPYPVVFDPSRFFSRLFGLGMFFWGIIFFIYFLSPEVRGYYGRE